MDETTRLKKYTEEIQEDLRIDRQRKKPKPNENMDADIPDNLKSFDFWCDTCQEDFEAPARKTRYRMEGDVIATMRGECPECGETVIRYVTHRDQDPYYQRSMKIHRQRNQYRTEMLQAEEYGFKTHYGDPNEIVDKKLAEQEKKIAKADLSIGLKGQSLKAKRKLEQLRQVNEWRK
mgnify:CR=1 FL=1